MDIKHLHSTRFLPLKLVLVLSMVLTGCAGSPEEPYEVEELEVVTTPVEAPAEPAPQPVELKPNYPEKYVVVKGDTLWDISASFLKDPWKWPRLWHFNPHIANPHLIYPGDILTIVFVNGHPVMQITRDGQTFGPDEGKGADTSLPPEVLKSGQRYPTVKLSPRIREIGLDEAIPTISINAIGPFLSRPRVMGEGELEMAPYVMDNDEHRLLSGDGFKVYARGFKENELQGNYVVVRAGDVYRNPQNWDDILGYEAIYIGEAKLNRVGDPVTMEITNSTREILRGDRLIPKGDEIIQHSFTPRAPDHKVNGRIIAVPGGLSMIGQYQVVVIDLGRQDDVLPGHVLAINQSGDEVEDEVVNGEKVTLPTERAGVAMIFRVFDRVSYALVMDATRTMKKLDEVTNP